MLDAKRSSKKQAIFPRVLLWGFGFARKKAAASLIVFALMSGGVASAAATVPATVATYAAVIASGLGIWAARPRQIGTTRHAADGTRWQDFDNGTTLITRANGGWSLVRSK